VPRFEDRLPWDELRAASVALPREFYLRPAAEVARSLLGKILVHGELAGEIVEAEAYLGENDLAAHASRGVTPRTRVIFGPPGHAYVYLIYGMYECLNLVAEPAGVAGCVLIRAVDPLCGLAEMSARRPAVRRPEDLASGPGKLTRALGITREQNGVDVTAESGGPLVVRAWRGEEQPRPAIVAGPRIGIRECTDWPLRFYYAGHRAVSRVRA
jgi:DNA-3-methyladenine glycosylase